jgi:hypothetical protein
MGARVNRKRWAVRACLSLGVVGIVHAAGPEAVLLNPFGDPFVQATQGRACPAPLGPAYTETERRQEAHSRIERGTSCWLAGQCKEPNSYNYDAPIARAVVAALRADAALADTALWVIAERRFVYLQGCVATQAQADRAEVLTKAVPDVQYVLPKLTLPGERPRYRLAPAPADSAASR